MNASFRVLEDWPGKKTEDRQPSPFKARWRDTLDLIKYELGRLGAQAVVVSADFKDRDIRIDGWPRLDARKPEFPGVIIEWQMNDAWYRRKNDQYLDWTDNLRGIALTLKALRDIERWGAVEGEQYEGLRLELEAGNPYDTGMSAHYAALLIDSHGGLAGALKATHPDHGGTVEEFNRVIEARKVLGL